MLRSDDRATGLVFQDQAPVIASDPNRADVALFVGFVRRRGPRLPAPIYTWLQAQGWTWVDASRQPLRDLLDVPTPIDNWQAFDRLFAWEQRSIQDSPTQAYTPLGAAVRSFFQQGGRKCYVVRMGDPPEIATRPGTPARTDDEVTALIGRLIPGYPNGFAGSPLEPAEWHGVGHLFGLPDVSFLALPDLADIVATGIEDPGAASLPQFPEVFVECSSDEQTGLRQDPIPRLRAPRCAAGGYEQWARALSLCADLLARQRREVQLVAGIPLPESGSAAERDLLESLIANGRGPLANLPGIHPAGIASAFVQLAYPWLRTAASVHLPEGLENPEGVLVGLLSRAALSIGAFHSAAGQAISEVYDIAPRLTRGQVLAPQADIGPGGAAGEHGLFERVSLFDELPEGIVLFSDVTTSLNESYRPANINRLVSVIVRAARRLGEEMTFESSGEMLWNRLRRNLEDLLLALLRAGALNGAAPEDAFSVRCDRSTMTQNDIDAGRLVAEVQFTASAPVERITVVLAVNESGQVALLSNSAIEAPPEFARLTSDQVSAEAFGSDRLDDLAWLDDHTPPLRVRLEGREQSLRLSPGSYTPTALANAINSRLRGGYARISRADDPAGSGLLVIGSDRRGRQASVEVFANPACGFNPQVTSSRDTAEEAL